MTIENSPLGLEDKIYSETEFARAIRNKFGTNDNLPDSVLVSNFIDKYPMYSCKIKTYKAKVRCVVVDV